MNMLKHLKAVIEYMEVNLWAELDLDTAAGIACVTADSFLRFFRYRTGMALTEYIRRRRRLAQSVFTCFLSHYDERSKRNGFHNY